MCFGEGGGGGNIGFLFCLIFFWENVDWNWKFRKLMKIVNNKL